MASESEWIEVQVHRWKYGNEWRRKIFVCGEKHEMNSVRDGKIPPPSSFKRSTCTAGWSWKRMENYFSHTCVCVCLVHRITFTLFLSISLCVASRLWWAAAAGEGKRRQQRNIGRHKWQACVSCLTIKKASERRWLRERTTTCWLGWDVSCGYFALSFYVVWHASRSSHVEASKDTSIAPFESSWNIRTTQLLFLSQTSLIPLRLERIF